MTNQREKCQRKRKDNIFDNFLKGYTCYLLFSSQLDPIFKHKTEQLIFLYLMPFSYVKKLSIFFQRIVRKDPAPIYKKLIRPLYSLLDILKHFY